MGFDGPTRCPPSGSSLRKERKLSGDMHEGDMAGRALARQTTLKLM